MELEPKDTKYGSLVRQLGGISIYFITRSCLLRYFDNLEEARQAALAHEVRNLKRYKRECAGKWWAREHITILSIEQGG
jgi:hypothetical protein